MGRIEYDTFDARAVARNAIDATLIPDDVRDRARKTVAAYAVDAAEAAELMKMIGIYPGQKIERFTTSAATLVTSAATSARVS